MSSNLDNLIYRIDIARTSKKACRLVREIAASGDPGVIPALVSLLDYQCEIGRAVVDALVGLGPAVEPEMRRCLEADEETVIRNAHRVLARLGDRRSEFAKEAYCWADLADPSEQVFWALLFIDVEEWLRACADSPANDVERRAEPAVPARTPSNDDREPGDVA